MGFSVSGATALLFVAMFIAFGMFQTATVNGLEQVEDARTTAGERLLEQRNTDVAVSDVSYNATSDALSVRVNNTGATALSVSGVDLLVDGDYVATDKQVAGAASTDQWHPGETLVLNATVTNATRVKVVTGPGVAVTEVV